MDMGQVFREVSSRLVKNVTEIANTLGAGVSERQVEIVIEAMNVEAVYREEVAEKKRKKATKTA
jgi:hypothetical protein